MLRRILPLVMVAVLLVAPGFSDEGGGPPTLAIGAAAPDFCLLGIDGQSHCLKDYAASKVLVLAFTCNHCPTAQLYEARIKQLAADYKDKGVTVVAIEPNSPNAVRLDEMGYTDVGDSLEDMRRGPPTVILTFLTYMTGKRRRCRRHTGQRPLRIFSSSMRNGSCAMRDESITIRASRW